MVDIERKKENKGILKERILKEETLKERKHTNIKERLKNLRNNLKKITYIL